MTDRPIGDYGMLSDSHSAALVSRDGSVDWLCFPRFDAPSVFARILDDDAGHWSLRPAHEGYSVARRYLDGTMILETTFETSRGTLVLTDAMPFAHTADELHDLGTAAPNALVRRVACTRGTVEVAIEYAPRPEYGLMIPILVAGDGGLVSRGGSSTLVFSTPVPVEVDDSGTAMGTVRLTAGQQRCFALRHEPSHHVTPGFWDEDTVTTWLEDTRTEWRQWTGQHSRYEGPWDHLVETAGRVLQSLMYQPTGAIVAAPTTSLPEDIGGGRNWDYRYSWIRDASLTIHALHVAACPKEARRYFDWLVRTAGGNVRAGQHLQVVYGIGGEHEIGERALPHLDGWRASRPVRVGNGACDQLQLDVYGELMDAYHRSAVSIDELDELTRAFLVDLADAAARRWREPDHGIWEMRDAPRHFTYSKLMCWVALDRALSLAPSLGVADRAADWRRARDGITDAIHERAWNPERGAFVQAFDSNHLDASVLRLPIVGFIDARDERMRSTVEVIERELTDDRGLVYRYLAPDGLPGGEGTFLLCTFWLARCLALAGDTTRAREVVDRAVSHSNDLGLFSEEIGPSGELLGNFPQAFSHIGLVNAAWTIAQVEHGARAGSHGTRTGTAR